MLGMAHYQGMYAIIAYGDADKLYDVVVVMNLAKDFDLENYRHFLPCLIFVALTVIYSKGHADDGQLIATTLQTCGRRAAPLIWLA
jgi:hypothetical protein